jgi:hypothetical protein
MAELVSSLVKTLSASALVFYKSSIDLYNPVASFSPSATVPICSFN